MTAADWAWGSVVVFGLGGTIVAAICGAGRPRPSASARSGGAVGRRAGAGSDHPTAPHHDDIPPVIEREADDLLLNARIADFNRTARPAHHQRRGDQP